MKAFGQGPVKVSESNKRIAFKQDSTLNEFRIYIQRNIDYSLIDSNKILKKNKGTQPRVYLQLAITTEGTVTDVSVLKPLQVDFDKQVIKIIQESIGWVNFTKQKAQLTISVVFDPNGEYLKTLEQQRAK
jgi:TonB family protein